MKPVAPLLLILGLTSCQSVPPVARTVGTPASPASTWTPPASVVVPEPVAATQRDVLPAGYTPGMTVTLPQVLDIALSNNTTTRMSWLAARAAEARLGAANADYLPDLGLNASVNHTRSASQGGASTSSSTTFGPSLTLNYLLFDFGGRRADVEQARFALIAADLDHNQAVQDVILQTQQAYYGYLGSRALLEAQEATVRERRKELEAAEARQKAGVATIADVLQSRTALSQAQLNRETIEGQVRAVEGLLATTMGLPATTRFDFGALPVEVPLGVVSDTVDALIATAVRERPELAAARADAERARHRIRSVRAQGLPTIGLSSTVSQTFYDGGGNATPYAAGVNFRWPFFTGFRNQFEVRAAELEAQLAAEGVRSVEQRVNLQVWTSYFAVQTAKQRLTTARDFLASAQQSAEVARSRYRAGVGSIVDLLTAEAALETARAQEVIARTDWFLAIAQLAHDTGTLRQGTTNAI